MSGLTCKSKGTRVWLAAALVAPLAVVWPATLSLAAPNNNVSLRASTDLTPDFVPPGATNLTILTFTLRDDSLNEYFTEALVEYTGTAIGDLAALHLYCESDRAGGSFDPAKDSRLGTNASPSSSPIVLTLNFRMPLLLDQQFYLVVDLKESAAHGSKVDLRILRNGLTIDGKTCPSANIDPAGETVIDALPPGSTQPHQTAALQCSMEHPG